MRILIIGAGGHGQVVADIFRAARQRRYPVEVVGYLDDNPTIHGRTLVDSPVLGPVEAIDSVHRYASIVAIGDNDARARVFERLVADGELMAVAIHPDAILSQDIRIGDGAMVCAGAVVNTGCAIGRGVILNTSCSVDHHTIVGDFAHIAPGVHMGGEVRVGERALVGIGATVLPRITIGAGSIVAAGAVVTRDVPAGATVAGVPAKESRNSLRSVV